MTDLDKERRAHDATKAVLADVRRQLRNSKAETRRHRADKRRLAAGIANARLRKALSLCGLTSQEIATIERDGAPVVRILRDALSSRRPHPSMGDVTVTVTEGEPSAPTTTTTRKKTVDLRP